jgi:ribosomal protein S18 acetylase RimI-like enzyme
MTTIRQITGAHTPDSPLVAELVRVFGEARRQHLQFLIDLHSPDEDRYFFSGVVLPQNEVWVAEVDRRLAGFVAFAPGWVNHLYIAPAYQRQGLGRRLLDLAKASGPTLQLWAFEANPPAIAFYQSQGFRVAERTDGAANEAKMPDVRMEWRA